MFRTVQANQTDQWLTSAERKPCGECDYNIICTVYNISYLCSNLKIFQHSMFSIIKLNVIIFPVRRNLLP